MILVLAPHCDDELHCGGLLARLAAPTSLHGTYGSHVRVLAFTNCMRADLTKEWERALDILGPTEGLGRSHMLLTVRRFAEYRQYIRDAMVRELEEFKPDMVLCPSSTDLHQDHAVVYEEAMRIFRNARLLLGYECPANQRVSRVNVFVELTEEHLATKLKAEACYESQQHRLTIGLTNLASVRGMQCRCESGLAEGYELLSMRI